jgi:hypothetical protein
MNSSNDAVARSVIVGSGLSAVIAAACHGSERTAVGARDHIELAVTYRAAMWAAVRQARAMMVSDGLAPPLVTWRLASAM